VKMQVPPIAGRHEILTYTWQAGPQLRHMRSVTGSGTFYHEEA